MTPASSLKTAFRGFLFVTKNLNGLRALRIVVAAARQNWLKPSQKRITIMPEPKETDTLDAESQAIIDEELAAAAEKAKQTEMIPKERLDAVLAESKAKDAMLKTFQEQMELMRANMPQAKAEAKQPNILDGIFAEDDTVVDRKQLEMALNRVLGHINNVAGQFAVQQQHTDFQAVIAEHLPEIVKSDPTVFAHLQELYKTNPALAGATAYRLAKTTSTYLEQQNKIKTTQQDNEKTNSAIQELLKNRQTPQSISALGAGGGTAGSSGSPLLDKMMELDKPEDFNRFADDLKSGAVDLAKL